MLDGSQILYALHVLDIYTRELTRNNSVCREMSDDDGGTQVKGKGPPASFLTTER
jgi:hypothetical protein